MRSNNFLENIIYHLQKYMDENRVSISKMSEITKVNKNKTAFVLRRAAKNISFSCVLAFSEKLGIDIEDLLYGSSVQKNEKRIDDVLATEIFIYLLEKLPEDKIHEAFHITPKVYKACHMFKGGTLDKGIADYIISKHLDNP